MMTEENLENKGDILVVDDVLTNLRLLSKTLSAEGYRVRPARSGSLALTMAQAAIPDLILLDVMMPEMDGYEVCRHLKADPLTRDVPIIFISAKDDKEARLKGFQLGSVDYITKPFYHEEVLARVNLHLTLRILQKQLLQRNSELDLLRKLAEIFNQMREREQATWEGLHSIVNLLDASCGWLVLFNGSEKPHLEAHHGVTETELEWINAQLRSPSESADTPATLINPQILPSRGCLGETENQDTFWVRIPLHMGNHTNGILNLVMPSVAVLEMEDFRLLKTIASQYSQTIERVLLFDEVQQLAKTDSLTKLFNRRYFLEIAQREVEKSRRYQRSISLLMIDIDHFKQVNDTFGHTAGDQALIRVAASCQENLRQVDVICRYGGEEFICLLPETNLPNAIQTAERLRRTIESLSIQTSTGEIHLTISIGVASNLPKDITLEAMIDLADRAMYTAKQDGRNKVGIFPVAGEYNFGSAGDNTSQPFPGSAPGEQPRQGRN